jgi:hypothetical protein
MANLPIASPRHLGPLPRLRRQRKMPSIARTPLLHKPASTTRQLPRIMALFLVLLQQVRAEHFNLEVVMPSIAQTANSCLQGPRMHGIVSLYADLGSADE